LVLTLLLAGASVSAVALFPREVPGGAPVTPEQLQDQRSELERFMATEPRVPLVIPMQGAVVLIVKFNDYQCPACSQSYQLYKPVLAKYATSNPGAVRMVLRDFPLNPACNDTVKQVIHPAACEAAVAVRLARLQNRGDAMEDWLYTHQEGMTAQTVKQAAREVGQVADFDAKYAPTLELVKGDVSVGRQLKVSSTPTFFINGVKFSGAIAPQFFDQAIAYELQHAGTK
jgi:protein-disulfide isomerase